MGDAWRIGVDPEERTELVTDGPFGLVRNPIYSAMIPTVLGLVLMVPNVLAIAAIACLVIALELQVRLVEEPHLLRTHGERLRRVRRKRRPLRPGAGLPAGPHPEIARTEPDRVAEALRELLASSRHRVGGDGRELA